MGLEPDARLLGLLRIALSQGGQLGNTIGVHGNQIPGALELATGGGGLLHRLRDRLLQLRERLARGLGLALSAFDLLVQLVQLALEDLQLASELVDLLGVFRELLAGHVDIQPAHLLGQLLVAPGLAGLPLERDDLPLHLADHVGEAQKVGLGVFELAQRLLLVGLVFGDAAGLLEDGAAILRPRAEDLVDLSLLEDGIGVGADAGIHEETMDVLETAGLAVDEVSAFAGTENAAGDADLIVFHAEGFGAVGERNAHLGHAQRLLRVGSVEDDILHLRAAQRAGALFAQHPAHRIGNIALAAPVRPDDRGHPRLELELGLVRKTFEPHDFQTFKVHSRHSLHKKQSDKLA